MPKATVTAGMGETTQFELNYHLTGTGSKALCFVHGFACAWQDWREQIDALSSTFRILALDLPGHGASGWDPSNVGVGPAGASVAQLLEQLDLSDVTLIGHSMGCRVIMSALEHAPDRVGALAFIDGSWFGRGDPDALYRSTRAKMMQPEYPAVVAGLFRHMFTVHSDAATRDDSIARAGALEQSVGASYFASMTAWDAGKTEQLIADATVPMLVVQSTYLNEAAERVLLKAGESTPWMDLVRRSQPGAKLHVIADVGHFNMLEAAEETTALLRNFVSAA
jgi:pimeloyl-ACP methyl ester carboxylesterase